MSKQDPGYKLAERTAHILGDQSAAAQALAKYAECESNGKSPQLLYEQGRFVVIHDTRHPGDWPAPHTPEIKP